jgi:hypothetical protein
MKEPVRFLCDASAPEEVVALLRVATPPASLPKSVRAASEARVVALATRKSPVVSVRTLVLGAVALAAAALLAYGLMDEPRATEEAIAPLGSEGARPDAARVGQVEARERTTEKPPVEVVPRGSEHHEETSPPASPPRGRELQRGDPSRTQARRVQTQVAQTQVAQAPEASTPSTTSREPSAMTSCVAEANYNQCLIQRLANPRTPREYAALATAFNERGASARGCELMRTLVERFPSSLEARRMSQILTRQCTAADVGSLEWLEPGNGALVIHSVPWARVYVDGRDTGRNTPIRDLPVSAGDHEITFVTEDGAEHRTRIHVEPGETVRVVRQLGSR